MHARTLKPTLLIGLLRGTGRWGRAHLFGWHSDAADHSCSTPQISLLTTARRRALTRKVLLRLMSLTNRNGYLVVAATLDEQPYLWEDHLGVYLSVTSVNAAVNAF